VAQFSGKPEMQTQVPWERGALTRATKKGGRKGEGQSRGDYLHNSCQGTSAQAEQGQINDASANFGHPARTEGNIQRRGMRVGSGSRGLLPLRGGEPLKEGTIAQVGTGGSVFVRGAFRGKLSGSLVDPPGPLQCKQDLGEGLR